MHFEYGFVSPSMGLIVGPFAAFGGVFPEDHLIRHIERHGWYSLGNCILIQLILAFPILAGATFGVLLCMDSMECFLHTLRLHWV